MRGKTHLIFGIATAVAYVNFVDFNIGIIAGTLAGSLLPDVDSEESTINRLCPPIAAAYKRLHKMSFRYRGNLYLWTKHRGAMMHSIWTLVALFVLAVITPSQIDNMVYGLILGVSGHHFLDSLTPAGIRWLYPKKI